MDPNVIWRELAEAFEAKNEDYAYDMARDLLEWLNKGGFPPHITGNRRFDTIVAVGTCVGLLN